MGPHWEAKAQLYNSLLTYMRERMKSTLPELVPAGARRMKLQFPLLAQIKCRYEPVWNECLTLGVFAISEQNLFSLGF